MKRQISDLTNLEYSHIAKICGYEENDRDSIDKREGHWRKTIDLYNFQIVDDCYERDFVSYHPIPNAYKVINYLLSIGVNVLDND